MSEKVVVVLSRFNERRGEIVEAVGTGDHVKIRLEAGGRVLECRPAEEGKYRPVQTPFSNVRLKHPETGNDALDLMIGCAFFMVTILYVVLSVIKAYCAYTYRAIPQKTIDRLAAFYGASVLIFMMMMNSLLQAIGGFGSALSSRSGSGGSHGWYGASSVPDTPSTNLPK